VLRKISEGNLETVDPRSRQQSKNRFSKIVSARIMMTAMKPHEVVVPDAYEVIKTISNILA